MTTTATETSVTLPRDVNQALGIEAQGFTEGAFCPIPEQPGPL